MYELRIGEIRQEWEANWSEKNKSNSEVLDTIFYNRATCVDAIVELLKHLHDEIKLDWGMWAWKATKSELSMLKQNAMFSSIDLAYYLDGKEYGVVFIEDISEE